MAGFRSFAAAVVRANPGRLAFATLIQVVAAASQVAGLFLLVPMLAAVGVATGGSADGVVHFWRSAFDAFGVELTLRSMLVVYVVTAGVAAGLNAWSSVLTAAYRLDYTNDLRARVHNAIADAEWRHLAALRRSDLTATVTTNVSMASMGAVGVLSLSASVLVAAAQVVVAARLSVAVTALAGAASGLLIALAWPFVTRARRLGEENVARVHALFASLTDFLDGLKLVKLHARERAHSEAFAASAAEQRDTEVRLAAATAVSTAVQLAATAAVLAIVVDVAIERFDVGAASLLVLAFIFMRLVPQLTAVQRNLQQIAQALPAFEQLTALVAACEAAPDAHDSGPAPAMRKGVSLRHVHFAYDDAPVLRDVSIDVPLGATVALVGPSGAGKTTVADIVAGLLQPTSGEMLVDDVSIAAHRRSWRASIALVPQEPFLFHASIRTNLSWAAPEASEDAMWQALGRAAVDDVVRALPDGLDTVVADRGLRLSGGERQRVALARSLLRSPQLLILDEATSSLDTENEKLIRDALGQLRRELTMLVIAHRLSTVRDADHVVVLDGGRVVEQGSWSELAAQPDGRLRSLLEAGLAD